MNLSDWIQVFIFFAIGVYTVFTYILLRQQRKQFELANRPWLYAVDISYDPMHGEMAIRIVNSGRMPAEYEAHISQLQVTPFLGDVPIPLGTLKDEPHRSIVFPHVDNVTMSYIIPIRFGETQIAYLTKNVKLEVALTLRYRTVMNEKRFFGKKPDEAIAALKRMPYSFVATLVIGNFQPENKNQNSVVLDPTVQ